MDSVWLRRGLLAVVILLAVGCVAALLLPDRQTEPQMQAGTDAPSSQDMTQTPPPEEQIPEPETTEQPDHLYEMGIWEGKVAVFLPGTDLPMRITEMPASSLPEADQQALAARIPVYDAQQLASFLEDYGS